MKYQGHHQMQHCALTMYLDKQEEMKRGYFEDFKDLKETQGRMFEPSEALSPPSTSTQLPNIAVRLTTPSIVLLPSSFPGSPECGPACFV